MTELTFFFKYNSKQHFLSHCRLPSMSSFVILIQRQNAGISPLNEDGKI